MTDHARPSDAPASRGAWTRVLIGLLLVAATLAVFGQVIGFDFVGYDDSAYVTGNPRVRAGPTPDNLLWALLDHRIYWHPLTWLSLMLDARLGHLSPAVFHASSLLIHVANTLLVFLIFDRMTGFVWRSALVAALFAVHPLHVESVAWIAERKDVLSTFFLLAAVLAYLRYVRAPGSGRYLAIVGAFSLAIMAKPMVVTLPLALLLLDYWPLGRFGGPGAAARKGKGPLRELVLEKAPLLLLSAAACVFAIVAQERAGAMGTFERYPLSARVANALVSYATYLVETFWPRDLAVIYPHPGATLPPARVIGAGLLFSAVTALAVLLRRRAPYLLIGWAWYLVTLLPAIGLVQVGVQARADRYTYVPLLGIFVMIVWGVLDLVERGRGTEDEHDAAGSSSALPARPSLSHVLHRFGVPAVSMLAVLALMVRAHAQAGHWRDGVTLFRHAVAVTRDNKFARNNLGLALYSKGLASEAAAEFSEALRIDPGNVDARCNLAAVLMDHGRMEEAAALCREALSIDPRSAAALTNLGKALLLQGKLAEAEAALTEAIRINPDDLLARNNLGVCLAQQRRFDEAIAAFTEILKIAPDDPGALENLALTEKLRAATPSPARQ